MSGGKFKPWHILIILAGIAALAWGAYRLMSAGGPEANWAKSITAVDVVTGQLFEYPLGKSPAIFPAENPETKQRTVVPITEVEAGVWRIQPQYSSFIADLGSKAKAVDASGRVTPSGEPTRVE